MAGALFHIRASFKARSCILLKSKLLHSESYYADDSTKKHNLYETLEIPSNASHGEIKKAYYDLTKRYHPDRKENCDISATKFREVAEAYEVLGNFSLRKKYDRGIPLSRLTKTVPVPVDHKVKYQEFYDSRTAQSDIKDDSKDFDDFANFSEKKIEDKFNFERKEVVSSSSRGVQIVIIVFFGVLIFLFKQ